EEQQPEREQPAERLAEPPLRRPLVLDVVRLEQRDQLFVFGDAHGGEHTRHAGAVNAVGDGRTQHVVAYADLLDLARRDPRLHLAVGDPRRVLLAEQVVDAEEDQEGEEKIEDGETGAPVPHGPAHPTRPPVLRALAPLARPAAVPESSPALTIHPARWGARIIPRAGISPRPCPN